MLRLGYRLFRFLLLLALGLALLIRVLEWYGARLDALSRGQVPPGATLPSPTTLPAPASIPGAPSADPPLQSSSAPASAPPDERNPGLVQVSGGAAFSVAPGLYATSESLTDGYGHLAGMRLPGTVDIGKVVVHDRDGSGVAIVSARDNLPLPTLPLATAASLAQGQEIRALFPLPSAQPGLARPAPGAFSRVRFLGKVVVLEAGLGGPLVAGAPILDVAGRVVGIVVGRREQREHWLVAADHIDELLARARKAAPPSGPRSP